MVVIRGRELVHRTPIGWEFGSIALSQMREAALPLFHVSCDEGYSQLLAGLPRLFTDRRDNITFTYKLAELWRRRLLQKLTIVSVACISTEVRDRADRR